MLTEFIQSYKMAAAMDKIVYLVALIIWKGGDYSQKQTWRIFLEGLSETPKEQISDQTSALRAET